MRHRGSTLSRRRALEHCHSSFDPCTRTISRHLPYRHRPHHEAAPAAVTADLACAQSTIRLFRSCGGDSANRVLAGFLRHRGRAGGAKKISEAGRSFWLFASPFQFLHHRRARGAKTISEAERSPSGFLLHLFTFCIIGAPKARRKFLRPSGLFGFLLHLMAFCIIGAPEARRKFLRPSGLLSAFCIIL